MRVDIYCPAIQAPDNVYVLGADLSVFIAGDEDRKPVEAELAEFGCSLIWGHPAPSYLVITADPDSPMDTAAADPSAALEDLLKAFLHGPADGSLSIRRARLRGYAALAKTAASS